MCNVYIFLATTCRFNQSESTWHREFKSEYLFPLTWDNPGLEEYLNKHNYLTPVRSYILSITGYVLQRREGCVVWFVCGSAT